MNNSGAFRKKKVYFTQVSNHILRNPDISLKAKGLYSLIQSYLTIEDFTLYKSHLRKQCKEGEKAFESAWKELKDTGYLIQYRLKNLKDGTFYYEYELMDEVEEKIQPKDIEQSEKVHTPKKVDMDTSKTHTPKMEGVDNGHCGKGDTAKGGVYNNTNSNNTNSNNTNGNKKEDAVLPINSNPSIIEKFYNLIQQELSDVSFNTWIKPLIIHIDKKVVEIEVANNFSYKIVKDRYLDIIKKNFKELEIERIKLKEKTLV